MDASADAPRRSFAFGLERVGFFGINAPYLTCLCIVLFSVLGVLGLLRLKVDDSLSELFRTNTEEFRRYEEIDRRFPSSEYDVLVVVEGKDLLKKPQLEAFRRAIIDLQLADGVDGVVSMLSARGKPDASGYAAPIVPDELPDDAQAYGAIIDALRSNEIVAGKFLSPDGELALAVIALDRKAVEEQSAKVIIGGIADQLSKELSPVGLKSHLTGAPVMQLEIRNAVERDQILYNGLGLLFGATIAAVFFKRVSLMLLAALPPVLAVLWSLGLLGWIGFKLNLFLNVMTPLVMVMGFADSMQMVSAIRIRLREGDSKREAVRFAVRIVGPACVLAHGTALLSFIALLFSPSGLIRTFGMAGALAVCISFVAVLLVLPLLGLILIRNEASLARDRSPADRLMDGLGGLVGWIVDRVVRWPLTTTLVALGSFLLLGHAYLQLEPRYRLADQVPDREQALGATERIDQKLTGANPVHIMIEWQTGESIYAPGPLSVIAAAHEVLEKQAGLGNVWSLESLRRWLRDAGEDSPETIKKYVGYLPEHLVRRFIAKEGNAVLVTGRLPDVDSSRILPVVEKIDRALDQVRVQYPQFRLSVTGLPAIAARNSARMISQLSESLPICVAFAALLLALAFRSVFVGLVSLLPGLYPVVASGAIIQWTGGGLEFASVVALLVVFGLAIDALIHFFNRLSLEERREPRPEVAIRNARVLVGPAIILTTLVLAFGLGVTVFSDLPSLRTFGFVCGTTLLASLMADLVFLPGLIMLVRKVWRVKGPTPAG
ncbi:MAG TPA: MMPL family transporter [Hyphomicrobiaceae bacterium]|jgi:predicted RND superfamily exporter protein|nr:MMPL family transporter [Hyphomicrobiaceae bacterium]